MTEAVAVDLDRVLGDTRPLWRAFVEDAARRYAPIAPLDRAALSEDRAVAASELDSWAAAGVGDWRKALERFAEDHASIYLRPDPGVNAAVRRLAAGYRVGVVTDAPETLARIALAQLGIARAVDAIETGAGALERIRERYGSDVRVIRTAEALAALASEAGSPATRP